MDMIVEPIEGLRGELKAPPSKSHIHRALIMGSLAEGDTYIKNIGALSEKHSATIRAIEAFGARVERIRGGYKVTGSLYKTPDDILDVGNSGTTISFLLGVSATAPGASIFTGDESIRKRPLGPLLDALGQLGIECWSTRNNGLPPIVVKGGGIRGGACKVSGFISQWTSSLLLAAPLAEHDTQIEIIDKAREWPYIEMTCAMLKEFGIKISKEERGYFEVPSNQSYRPAIVEIPGDFGLAAFGLAAAALGNSEVILRNLDMRTIHGEKSIVNFLRAMGADVRVDEQSKSIRVNGGRRLEGIEMDVIDSPDNVPILAVLGSLSKGKTIIYNAEHTRYKECDRIKAMLQLKRMGAKIEEREYGLEIEGVDKLKGSEIESFGDHRVMMAFVVAGCYATGRTTISKAECFRISYPSFMKDMINLGMKLSWSK